MLFALPQPPGDSFQLPHFCSARKPNKKLTALTSHLLRQCVLRHRRRGQLADRNGQFVA
jgi:hypothetical protein